MLFFAVLSLLIWTYILLGRGAFWQVERFVIPAQELKRPGPRVVAVIPARNEAEVIARSIRSLLLQEYDPPLHVVLVDDASEDGTPALAIQAAEQLGFSDRLTVLEGAPLIPGWTGKLWALSQGAEHALASKPDYLLFTDADILHARDSLQRLAAVAQAKNCDLASVMVRLACQSFAEKALIPAFVFFFLELYPPTWVDSRKARTAGAPRGCILLRPQALARIGGLAAIRQQVIDDCALARAIKRSGGQIWLGLTSDTVSIRSYGSFSEIGQMISRTAFSQLSHSAWLLLATVIGLLVTYVIPIWVLLSSYWLTVVCGAAAWLLMTICY